jgi:hypothetical protein
MLSTQNYHNKQVKKLVNCVIFGFFILSLSVIAIWRIVLLHCEWTTVCCLSKPVGRVINSCEAESEEETVMHSEFAVIYVGQNMRSVM